MSKKTNDTQAIPAIEVSNKYSKPLWEKSFKGFSFARKDVTPLANETS
ncbi:hypothetical protein OHM91_08350 [Enterococcus faecalis]|nr:hypothetical protein [Enterococcus faecalis]OJG10044.1 hypothetical protein RU94_GL000790 [Enterococcus asini]